jgi:hypothetical protein
MMMMTQNNRHENKQELIEIEMETTPTASASVPASHQHQESDSGESHQNRFLQPLEQRDQQDTTFEGVSGDGSFEQSSNTFVFRTGDRKYQRGEQIYLCYGQYSNRSLIEIYGFLLEDNPQESVCLSLSEEVESNQIPDELKMIMSGGAGGSYEVYQNGYPSWDLLCLIRWKAAFDAKEICSLLDRKHTKKNGENWSKIRQGRMISPGLEEKAFAYLHSLCARKLKLYATSAEEDLLTLAGLEKKETALAATRRRGLNSIDIGSPLPPTSPQLQPKFQPELERLEHTKLALQWRLCQKKVLGKTMQICNTYREHLAKQPRLYQGF